MLEWREVDLGDVRATDLVNRTPYGRGMLVTGDDGGAAYVALVSAAGDVRRVGGAGESPVWSAVAPELDVEYTCGTPPRYLPHGGDGLVTGSSDDPPVRAWLTCGDEDPCTLTLGRSGQLFAYEPAAEEPTGGLRVRDGAAVDDLVVAGAEIGLVVGGPVAGTAGGDGVQAWRYVAEQWAPVPLAAPPDAFTDAYTRWEPVLAGHRDGLPAVFSHAGAALPAPRVTLDPAHPRVSVAHVDGPAYGSAEAGWEGRLSLVVQEREGVQVWLQHDGGWTMLPGPPGRLRAARFGYNEKAHAWCVTDHRLWHADLGALWDVLV